MIIGTTRLRDYFRTKSHNKDIEKADESEIEQRQREIIDSDGLGLRPRMGINCEIQAQL